MRQQLSLLSTMGIEQVILLINKMDTTDPPYSEDRFIEIKTELLLCLKKMCYQPQKIIFLPISACFGDNLVEPSNNTPWFDCQNAESDGNAFKCKTLLEALDHLIV